METISVEEKGWKSKETKEDKKEKVLVIGGMESTMYEIYQGGIYEKRDRFGETDENGLEEHVKRGTSDPEHAWGPGDRIRNLGHLPGGHAGENRDRVGETDG